MPWLGGSGQSNPAATSDRRRSRAGRVLSSLLTPFRPRSRQGKTHSDRGTIGAIDCGSAETPRPDQKPVEATSAPRSLDGSIPKTPREQLENDALQNPASKMRSNDRSSSCSEVEYCRLRASRGHLFEHFCREQFRSHELISTGTAEELHAELTDFAMRLHQDVPIDTFFPRNFMSPNCAQRPVVVPRGVIVFEVKQNLNSARHALHQLADRLTRVAEPSAAVLLTSVDHRPDLHQTALQRLYAEFSRDFAVMKPGIALLFACVQFNECAWAERVVNQLEQGSSDRCIVEGVAPGNPGVQSQPSNSSISQPQDPQVAVGRSAGKRRNRYRSRSSKLRGASRGESEPKADGVSSQQCQQLDSLHLQQPISGGAVDGSRARRGRSRRRRSQSNRARESESCDVVNAEPKAVAPPKRRSISLPRESLGLSEIEVSIPHMEALETGCAAPGCTHFHWPDSSTGAPCENCFYPPGKCNKCHCGQHLRQCRDTTRGAAAQSVWPPLSVWLMDACMVIVGRAPGLGDETKTSWRIPSGAVEVLLPLQPKLKSGGYTFDLIFRPDDRTFFLCRTRSKLPQRRRMPSATRSR